MSASNEAPNRTLFSSRADIGPDDVCRFYADSQILLKISLLKQSHFAGGARSILIEGDRQSLVFLADVLLAQAHADDCGFELSQRRPGNRLFAPRNEFGIYVHRLQ